MPARNDFSSAASKSAAGLNFPAESAEAVTPSDTTDLGVVSRALYVGGGGNVSVVMLGGQTITFSGVQAGALLPIRVARVRSTGTTATQLVALS
jgi:hypothetical protein